MKKSSRDYRKFNRKKHVRQRALFGALAINILHGVFQNAMIQQQPIPNGTKALQIAMNTIETAFNVTDIIKKHAETV